MPLTIADFIQKWRHTSLTERSAAQQHFLDLCEVFEHQKPAEVDPTGEWFTFERGAEKRGGGKGWADVWKRGYFAFEYKGKHKNMEAAYEQLLQYRESLENPPLLVVCDMERLVVHTNFTATVKQTYDIHLRELDRPRSIEIMRAVFHNPVALRPGETSQFITEQAAEQIGDVARGLEARGNDSATVARFLDRIVFCLFAEDVELLPKNLFNRLVEKSNFNPSRFKRLVEKLFDAMRDGDDDFGLESIPHFNGNLFTDSPVLELTSPEIESLAAAARRDWSQIDPAIFGTLFERGLDPAKRAQLGAQYTSREDIETLIEPVVLRPLRDEWESIKRRTSELLAANEEERKRRADVKDANRFLLREVTDKSFAEAQTLVRDFHERLATVKVLDPACGSGNFLYVTLQRLKDLEKEVLLAAREWRLGNLPARVSLAQFYGIEVNPYAFDLAQTTLWIGYLQWIRANGYGTPAEPILRSLEENFRNTDAILDLSDPEHPKEQEWAATDFIVGNPPFLGGSKIWEELGRDYQQKLWQIYQDRVPGAADLCCYWFEKARHHIAEGKTSRIGLLATQGIRGGANREVLKRIKETGDIFFAESDRDWVLNGANVHISMVGFDDGSQLEKTLDGMTVTNINANLSASSDITQAKRLEENLLISFRGDTKGGEFDVNESIALPMFYQPNPHGKPNSNVVVPWSNGLDVARRSRGMFIIDFGTQMSENDAAVYEAPFAHIQQHVFQERMKSNREIYKTFWWRHMEARPAMRKALAKLPRFLVTVMVAKHRLFTWMAAPTLPDQQLIVFARSDDYFFGLLHSRTHSIWSLAQGTQVRERESGFRYTPTTCFETFPFPAPSPAQEAAIADAAKELDKRRTAWLNPPEWTREETLEFRGSTSGAWAAYIHDADERGFGTVRYPRLVPRDAESAARLSKRTLTNLYNERPAWLDHIHNSMRRSATPTAGNTTSATPTSSRTCSR